MKTQIIPIGDRVIVKKLISSSSVNDMGIVLPFVGEKNENVWGEIVALPEVTENMWIKTMKVGDKILYKQFQTDEFTDDKSNENFVVVEVQPNSCSTKGQVWALIR